MSLEDELRQHFTSEPGTLPTGLGPEAVMRIGEEHRKSSRIRSGAAGFVVVSAAVLAVLALPNIGTDRSTDPSDIQAGPNTTLAPSGPVSSNPINRTPIETQTVDAAGLTWTISDPTLAWSRRLYADSSGFYALSTAPGTTWEDATEANGYRIPEAIYYSSDGITWTVRELPNDQYAADFGASDGTIYLLGTAPATSDPNGPVDIWIDTSSDLGQSWSRQTMPMSGHNPPEGLNDYVWSDTGTSLAAKGTTVIASVSTTYWVDVYRLAPEEYQVDGFDIRQTDTGMDIFDMSAIRDLERACEDAWYHYETDTPAEDRVDNVVPEACRAVEEAWQDPLNLVYSATWAELGIADIGPLSYSDLYVSDNGAAPVKIDTPFSSNVQGLQLSATSAGFHATVWGQTLTTNQEGWASALWTSTDGRSWSQTPAPEGSYEVAPLGSIGGRLVATAYNDRGTQVVVLDNGTWTPINIDASLGPVPDGRDRWISQGGAGEGGVWLVAQTTTYPAQGTEPAVTTTIPESGEYEGEPLKLDLLFSEDLVNWTVIDLTELLGPDAPSSDLWINEIVVSDEAVYFTVSGYNAERNETYAASVVGTK